MSAAPLLVVEGLRKRYGGIVAVAGVSFTLDAGMCLALIGPNGAGKSTLFNMLHGQVRPDAGRIRLDGRDARGWTPRRMFRAGVGRTFQIAAAFASLTLRENLQAVLISHRRRSFDPFRRARAQSVAEADDLLARLGLGDQADRAASELAYGDLKRLELAMTLAARPRLLLMDEPTAGMGLAERRSLMVDVRALADESGVAVLFTEHDMDAVFDFAHRILVMDRGALIADGPPDAVRGDERVRAVYLGRRHA